MLHKLLNFSRHYKIALLMLMDALLLPLALLTSVLLRLGGGWDPKLDHYLWIFAVPPLWVLPIFVKLGLYRAVLGYVDDKIVEYILRIVDATRFPEKYNLQLKSYIRFGASPRASIYLTRAARSRAMVEGRTYVKPDDVKAVMAEILRHRVIPTYEAEADEIDSDELVRRIREGVAVP